MYTYEKCYTCVINYLWVLCVLLGGTATTYRARCTRLHFLQYCFSSLLSIFVIASSLDVALSHICALCRINWANIYAYTSAKAIHRLIDRTHRRGIQTRIHCPGCYHLTRETPSSILVLCDSQYIYIWSIPTKVMHIGKKTTLLHSPEFFSLYRRHMVLSQKKYASS